MVCELLNSFLCSSLSPWGFSLRNQLTQTREECGLRANVEPTRSP